MLTVSWHMMNGVSFFCTIDKNNFTSKLVVYEHSLAIQIVLCRDLVGVMKMSLTVLIASAYPKYGGVTTPQIALITPMSLTVKATRVMLVRSSVTQ